MRERVLKQALVARLAFRHLSLPMRERVLKPSWKNTGSLCRPSLPMRERVLKRRLDIVPSGSIRVAPHAGACVETT